MRHVPRRARGMCADGAASTGDNAADARAEGGGQRGAGRRPPRLPPGVMVAALTTVISLYCMAP